MFFLRKFPAVLAVALLGLGAVSAGGASTAKVGLVATVRPCTVVVRGASSQTLHTGTYSVTVIDRSSTRFFKLRGPNVRKTTSVAFSGTAHWRLTFARGAYRYSCGASRRLRGTFTVSR
jgi:hypothetical protein